MIRVRQEHSDDGLRACVCSLLELGPTQARELPRSAAAGAGPWDEALRPHGYALLNAPPFVAAYSDAYWIMCVPSLHERAAHAIVMRGKRLVWDPGRRLPRYDQVRVDAEFERSMHGSANSAILLVPLDPRL